MYVDDGRGSHGQDETSHPQGPRSTRITIDMILNPVRPEGELQDRQEYWRSNSVETQSIGSSSPESQDYSPTYQNSQYQVGQPSSYRPDRTHDHRRALSRSSQISRERREFRPTYTQEENHFLWYHREDLRMDWTDVKRAFMEQFPHRDRKGVQGIQCKYYRFTEEIGLPKIRQRTRGPADRNYGIRIRLPGVWYPWMRPRSRS
ncbi:hypothetical protein MMC09_006164 [Bachmanniomyces sp. S44760]|nr:hypothetical protein [Bachmanniomyces sp. S44760]